MCILQHSLHKYVFDNYKIKIQNTLCASMHVMRQFDLSFYDNYSDVIYTYSYYGLDNNNL